MVLFASFVLPLVALGTAAVAASVPILIHLLSKQRVQVVDWAAMRFLMVAQKRKQRRIDQWILLALRACLLLVLLGGMVAVTPWAERAWQTISPGKLERASGYARTHHIFVIDASLSMATTTPNNQTRFEMALQKTEEAVRQAQPGDGFSLIVMTDQPQVLVPGPATDSEKFLAELKNLRVEHGTNDLNRTMNLISETLSRSPKTFPNRQVSFFTDLQRSAWQGLLPRSDGTLPEVWKTVTQRTDFVLVDVGQDDVPNLAITDLNTNDPVALVDSYTAVTVTVQNFTTTDQQQVRVELSLARPTTSTTDLLFIPIEQRLIEVLPAGQKVSLNFLLEGTARFRSPGLHLLQARILDQEDRMTIDDTRTLALNVRDSLPVLIVRGRSSFDVSRRNFDFLLEALQPLGRSLPGNPIRPRSITLKEFADPALGDLSQVDCVILDDVASLSPAQLGKLQTHLKRGGGIIVGFGPSTAENLDLANRSLWAQGEGILPGELMSLVQEDKLEQLGFRLYGDDAAYRRPPLAAFRDDNVRAGLTTVPFRSYLKLDAPPEGIATRLFSFVAADDPAKQQTGTKSANAPRPDPALVEWTRERGRVLVFTSSFQTDWNDWPILPTFLPFIHETVRHAALRGEQRTLRVNESIDEMYPATMVGLNAKIVGPEGFLATVPVTAIDEAGIVHLDETPLAGVYRISVPGQAERVVAVNPAETAPGGGSEFDLRQIDPGLLSTIPGVSIANDATVINSLSDEQVPTLTPRPHGPTIARWLVTLAFVLLIAESFVAWLLGPSRSRTVAGTSFPTNRIHFLSVFLGVAAVLVFIAVAALLALRLLDSQAGQLQQNLPEPIYQNLIQTFQVPEANAGESTKIQLETTTVFLPNQTDDEKLLWALGLLACVSTAVLYLRESRACGGLGRLCLPFLLRVAALALLLFWVMPQVLLAFNREGRPEVVILLDTSASMATMDDFTTPEIIAKADELKRIAGTSALDRLKLAQILLTRNDGEFLKRLLDERAVKLHIFSMDDLTTLVAESTEPSDAAEAALAINSLKPEGEASRLGDGVLAVLKNFRGGSLEAMIVFTDGIVTDGEELARAGRSAARAGVPLYLVGLGEQQDLPDASLSDLKAEEVVLKGDTLQLEARLAMKGLSPNAPAPVVPVVLSERIDEKLIERDRVLVPLDPSGRPVSIKLSTVPTETGERTFVIEVPKQPGETELGNNKLERVVLVTDTKTLKVLLLESYPRYEFRFLKVLLERESDAVLGNKSIELSSYLLEASAGYAEQDKSALRDLPTKTELMKYDIVLLGDIDVNQLPRANNFLADLNEFVKVRGGGLLLIAGVQSNPLAYLNTPLADLLPITATDRSRVEKIDDMKNLTEGYQLKFTPYGRSHALFRFMADESENLKTWSQLKPLFWYARGYVAKPLAEVLAVHPELPSESGPAVGNHPLVLQQFYGAGRVLFFGFDETWRWRFRANEEFYNRFWVQTLRTLARERVLRPELRTDKQTAYRANEPIRLTAQFPDDAPPIDNNTPVKVSLERLGPNRETIPLQLTKVEGTRGTYETLLTRTPVGDYRFELQSPLASLENKPRAEARVLPPPGERDRIALDRNGMMKAAAESRGKYYSLADVDSIWTDLPEFSRVPLNRPVPPYPLWNQFLIFALFLMILGTEWLLRRQAKLL